MGIIRRAYSKHARILRAWRRTRQGKDVVPYQVDWWDRAFYQGEITDRATIYWRRGLVQTALHYASVETIILPALQRQRMDRIIDIGSGAGHWLKFYQGLGSEAVGCEVSTKCVDHLRSSGYTVEHGAAAEVLPMLGHADVVNAIGVMFHIVDDAEWERTIHLVGAALKPGGLFVVGGHFGWLDGVNVQVGEDGTVNKRLRSARRWRKVLKGAGFSTVRIVRNRAYLRSTEPLPENNILFAYKV